MRFSRKAKPGGPEWNLNFRRGNDNPRAKLKEADVIAIRSNPDGLTGLQLAERYEVSSATVSEILRGKTWRHLL